MQKLKLVSGAGVFNMLGDQNHVITRGRRNLSRIVVSISLLIFAIDEYSTCNKWGDDHVSGHIHRMKPNEHSLKGYKESGQITTFEIGLCGSLSNIH